ncbi:MAG: PKD domain-containing protein [Acidobacteriota bacterium]
MNQQRLIVGCAIVILTVVGATPASAFEWIEECRNRVVWDTNTINMNVSAVDFPVGSQQRAAVERMRTAWNAESPGTNFTINYTFVANDNFVIGDGVNNIAIATAAEWNALGLPADVLAAAFPRYSRNNCPWLWGADPDIIEKDVIFNPTPDGNVWDFQINPPPPHPQGPFVLAIVGIHEFGHVFGADHENDVMSTLDEFYEDGGVIGNFNEIQPHADDTLAVRAGYGTAGTARDLAASAFQSRAGFPGESQPIPAPATAARNQPVNIRFTIENRGTTNQNSVRVEFFASTNRFITTGDTFLGAANFSLNAGALGTFNVAMTIPATLAAGNYHLGWIIDSPNSIAEVDEGNNGVGLVDQTTVTANSAPTACCTASPVFGTAPLNASFDASCSNDPDGGALTYTWDFDDGGTGTGQTTSHWFQDPGLYFVEVTVQEPGGLTDTSDCEVEVTCEDEGECDV